MAEAGENIAASVRQGIAQERTNRFAAGIMAVQTFGLATLVGLLRFSWIWFFCTLMILIIASKSKKFEKAVATLFGLAWAAVGMAAGLLFKSEGMAVVLIIIGFAMGFGVNILGAKWFRDAQ